MRVYIGKLSESTNIGVTKYHTRRHGRNFREISLNEEQMAALGLTLCAQCIQLSANDATLAKVNSAVALMEFDLEKLAKELLEYNVEIRLLFHQEGKTQPRVIFSNWDRA